MKRIPFYLLVAGTLIACLQQSAAQTTAFTYQGHLTVNGSPAAGMYDFRFRLAADPLANAYVGVPSLTNGIAVNNGLFTAPVDFGAAVFGGSNYWLEVDVRTNGGGSYTVLSPLQLLTPAPYALFADTASNVSGTVLAGQVSGTLAAAQLPPSVVTNNATGLNLSGTFVGNGASISNVDAVTLGGQPASAFWQLGGNNLSSGQVIGSINNQPVVIESAGKPVLQLTISSNAANGVGPNVLAGSTANYISNGVVGATICGGGSTNGFIFTSPGSGGSINNRGSNSVSADYGSIPGGFGNEVSGLAATALGDWNNADGNYSMALGYGCTAGGEGGMAFGNFANAGGQSAMAMGFGPTASGKLATAMGYESQAVHDYSFVWSDFDPGNYFSSTAANQFSVRAAGGIRLAGNVQLDSSTYRYLSLSGGNALGYLYGSFPKYADGVHLGYNYYADASGANHVANSGGATSRITAGYGFVDLAVGAVNAEPSSVMLHASSSGVSVYGTFNNFSDRNAKQDFAEVDRTHILDSLLRLPITEWSYKTDQSTRHVGPMAQDFYAIFNLGTDDKHIAPIDEGGVALAAIQGLDRKLEKKSDELSSRTRQLETENAELKQTVAELKQLVDAMNRRLNETAR